MVAMKLQKLIDNYPHLFLVDKLDVIYIMINSQWARVSYDMDQGTWDIFLSEQDDLKTVDVFCLVNGRWQWRVVKLF